MHVWKRFLLKLKSRFSRRTVGMHRLTLRLVVALITFTLGVVASAVWIIYHFSPAEKQEEPRSYQSSPIGSATLSEIATVAFCDLLAHPTDYNQKVIRTQADLFSYDHHLTLSDPSSCVLPDPMVGLELDPSLQYDPSDKAQKEVYDLLRTEGERKYGRSRVVIVGRFEGPIFSKDKRRSKYPHWFTIMRLEKAEPVIPDTN